MTGAKAASLLKRIDEAERARGAKGTLYVLSTFGEDEGLVLEAIAAGTYRDRVGRAPALRKGQALCLMTRPGNPDPALCSRASVAAALPDMARCLAFMVRAGMPPEEREYVNETVRHWRDLCERFGLPFETATETEFRDRMTGPQTPDRSVH